MTNHSTNSTKPDPSATVPT